MSVGEPELNQDQKLLGIVLVIKDDVAHKTRFFIFLKVADIFVKAFPNPEDIRVPLREKYHSLRQRLSHCVVKGTAGRFSVPAGKAALLGTLVCLDSTGPPGCAFLLLGDGVRRPPFPAQHQIRGERTGAGSHVALSLSN